MPRKDSRLITVDGAQYRWLVRRRPTVEAVVFRTARSGTHPAQVGTSRSIRRHGPWSSVSQGSKGGSTT
jgi:hypothetical protein